MYEIGGLSGNSIDAEWYSSENEQIGKKKAWRKSPCRRGRGRGGETGLKMQNSSNTLLDGKNK
jgi:hypothetical protein